jgi:hypothetical protein
MQEKRERSQIKWCEEREDETRRRKKKKNGEKRGKKA